MKLTKIQTYSDTFEPKCELYINLDQIVSINACWKNRDFSVISFPSNNDDGGGEYAVVRGRMDEVVDGLIRTAASLKD